MKLVVLVPGDCSAKQLAEFRELALAGRQVDPAGLERRIRNALFLAFVYDEQRLVSIGALKIPTDHHRADVFRLAGVPDRASDFPVEMGWAYTIPEYRGRGLHRQVIGDLLSRTGDNIFSTTKAANVPALLEGAGFTQTGSPYQNAQAETLHLFTFIRKK